MFHRFGILVDITGLVNPQFSTTVVEASAPIIHPGGGN